jgi:hypothetical protein
MHHPLLFGRRFSKMCDEIVISPEGIKDLRASDQGKNKTLFLLERQTRFYPPLVGNKIALWEALYIYLKIIFY